MLAELADGELDCLVALWQAQAEGEQALKLSEIHDRIGRRRAALGQGVPALTTISTYLRTLLLKKLVREVTIEDTTQETPRHGAVRVRGIVSAQPPARSPRTGYRAALPPGETLKDSFKALADAYPPSARRQAVLDFARALALPDRLIKKLDKALDE